MNRASIHPAALALAWAAAAPAAAATVSMAVDDNLPPYAPYILVRGDADIEVRKPRDRPATRTAATAPSTTNT